MTEAERIGVAVGVSFCGLAGGFAGGPVGIGVGLLVGVALGIMPWFGQPLWVWAVLFLGQSRPFALTEPVTSSNGRLSGGVRYQGGFAVAAIRVLGRAHQPTVDAAATADVLDIAGLLPGMRQVLGLTVDSLSVVSIGSRRRNVGDYPRFYDGMLGPAPFVGRRETFLVVRLRSRANAEALRFRTTVGAATLAAAQRLTAELRHRGIRAQVATAKDIVDLDRKLGGPVMGARNHRWHSVRGDDGWSTSYAYADRDLNGEVLQQVWTLRADSMIQNVTLFADGTATATVTLRHERPPTAVPSRRLRTLPGRQALGVAANLCGPGHRIRGVRRVAVPAALPVPIGASGVLLGRLPCGDRLLLPLADPGRSTRVHIAASDVVAKRVVMRVAAAGDRVTVHTRDFHRWMSLRMPGVTVSDQPQPDPGTTVSVVDGTLPVAAPVPRPGTVISVGTTDLPDPAGADVVIRQTGPAAVLVSAAGEDHLLDVEFFRSEDRYVSAVA